MFKISSVCVTGDLFSTGGSVCFLPTEGRFFLLVDLELDRNKGVLFFFLASETRSGVSYFTRLVELILGVVVVLARKTQLSKRNAE